MPKSPHGVTPYNPSTQEQLDWIRLCRSQNVSRNIFFHLLDVFDDVAEALENLADFSKLGGRDKPLIICPLEKAEKELENCHKIGAQIITFRDYRYSQLLREIPDPPPLITVLGNPSLLNQKTLGIVGPRNASYNGRKFAHHIAEELGKNGFVISSGLAKGIDTAAHSGSLATGTIAVVAGGIDNIYPRENENLYRQIAQKGLIISEQPFGTAPRGGNFPQRNRIISGLAFGSVIVEATLRSGTLITARFAVEQNREVFAVPGSPFDPRCQGTNRLIKQGAKLVENVEDILEDLINLNQDWQTPQRFMEPPAPDFIGFKPKTNNQNEVDQARQLILSKLSYNPINIEELSADLQIPERILNVALVQLELADKIQYEGGKICLRAS